MAHLNTSFKGFISRSLLGGLLITSLACSLLLTGCSKGGDVTGTSAEKVATVDGTVITKGDYDKLYAKAGKMFDIEHNPKAANNPLIQETLKRMVLQGLITSTLLKNDAKKEGVSVSPQEFKEFKDKQIQENGGVEKFKALLAENHLDESDLDDKINDQLLFNKLLEKRVGAQLKISDPMALEYYKSHPTEFNLPESFKASHILVKAIVPALKKEIRAKNPKITEEELNKEVEAQKAVLKAKAENLYAVVTQNPAQFAEVAKKSSDDVVSAQQGGSLGNVSEEGIDADFWKGLKATKPGTIHQGIVPTQFGFHIIQVQDHVSPHKQSFIEAKQQIIGMLSEQKKKSEMQKWFAEKQASANVKIEPAYQPVEAGAPGTAPGNAASGPQDGAQSAPGATPPPTSAPEGHP